MKAFAILVISLFTLAAGAQNACTSQRTIGADYGQAKYNCEVMLNGNAGDCQYYGNLWSCSCVQCPAPAGSGNFRRTIGSDYGQARYNCEVVLNGRAGQCQPSTNNLWYCDCSY